MQTSDSGVISAGAEITDLVLELDSNKQWLVRQWDALGALDFDTEAIDISTDVILNYRRDEEDNEKYTIDQRKLIFLMQQELVTFGSVEVSDIEISKSSRNAV